MKLRLVISTVLLFLCSTVLVSAQGTGWRAYMTSARQFNEKNQFAQGAQYAEAAVKMNPSSWEARYEAGRSYIGLGQHAKAVAHFRVALGSAPANYKSYLEKFIAKYGATSPASEGPPSSGTRSRNIQIFQDQLSHGAQVRVTSGGELTQKSSVVEDANQFRSGSKSLYFQMGKDISTNTHINIQGLWRSQNVPYPGDLTRYMEKGALSFWIKGKKEGMPYEIGFWTEAGQAPGQLLYSVLPLQKYCYVSTEWQQVIIPVTHFYNAYIWWRAPGTDGSGNRIWQRREAKMKWRDVGGIIFSAAQTKEGDPSFWIDDMALVASYDEKAMQALRALAQGAEGEKRKTDSLAVFEDSAEGEFWTNPPDTAMAIIDETEFYKGKKSLRVTLDTKAEDHSSVGTGFSEIDLSSILGRGALEYWARGQSGGEHWRNSLRCRIQGRDVWVNGPDVRSITDITKKWRKVKIRLLDFELIAKDASAEILREDKFDWKRVDSISWWIPPLPDSDMVFYLDEIKFVPR